MKSNISLSIVVVNFNTCELLRQCLKSILTRLEIRDVEIVVVDNHSDDDSIRMVRNNFPEIKIIANETNNGYSKATNQAIQISSGKYILVLNADTIMKPGAIQALYSYMERNPGCGIAGPKLLYPNGDLQYSCRTFQTIKTTLFRRTILGRIFPRSKALRDHLMLDWDHGSDREVDWLQGSAFMIRRSAIDQVGFMDERYFLYFEDVDLCHRMKNADWKVCYVPEAEILHYYKRGSYGNPLFNPDLLVHLMSMFRYYDKWNKMLYISKKCMRILKFPALIFLDFLGIWIAFWIAFHIRESIGTIGAKPLYPLAIYYKLLAVFSAVSLSIYYFIGLYETRGNQAWVDRLFSIAKGTLISCSIIVLLHFFSKGYESGLPYSRIVLVFFVVTTIFVIFLLHQSIFLISRLLWRYGLNLRRCLIVGTDQMTSRIEKVLSNKREVGYDLVGFVSLPYETENPWNLNFISHIDQLDQVCLKERIQEVIFVNTDQHFESIVLPLAKLRKNLISARIISNNFESAVLDTKIKDFFGFPALEFNCRSFYYAALCLKRFTDIFVALLCLIILSPLIFFICFLLRCENGRVFFVQQRVGKCGKKFHMYKFRSMVNNAETVNYELEEIISQGPIFKVRNDPRVTPIGKILRKYNLDEIPQFFNVLKGEMSVIGPRPPLPKEVSMYDQWHKARLEIKPGITGLWQIDKERKWRFDEMARLDIYYILNWSLLLDLKILLCTPGAMLRGANTQQ